MIQPWPKVRSKPLANYRVFQVRSDLRRSPRTGREHEFFVLECVNWVNVIALTAANQIILVEQFRHGTDSIELEIPGGMMDPGESSPVLTGLRELREETGYEGDRAELIGEVYPNPAIMNNICFTVLVQNCQMKHALELDHSEDIVTRLIPVAEIPDLVRSKRIRHSLVVAALYDFELWQRSSQRSS